MNNTRKKYSILALTLTVLLLISGCKTKPVKTSSEEKPTGVLENGQSTISEVSTLRSTSGSTENTEVSRTAEPSESSESEVVSQPDNTSSQTSEPEVKVPDAKMLSLYVNDEKRASLYSGVVATDDGGFVISGYYWSSKGEREYCIGIVEKHDKNGKLLLKKEFNGQQIFDIEKTKNNGFIIVSRMWEDTNKPGSCIFLVDNNFNIKWEKELILAQSPFSVSQYLLGLPQILNDGSIVYVQTDTGGTYLCKTDINGNEKSRINVYTKIDSLKEFYIQATADGGFYLTSSYSKDDTLFAENVVYNLKGYKGNLDCYIAKFDSNLSLKWIKSFGGSLDDMPINISGGTNSFYIAFKTKSADGDFSKTGAGSAGAESQLTVKFDLNGNSLYKVLLSSLKTSVVQNIECIKELSNGDLAVFGFFDSNSTALSSYKIDYTFQDIYSEPLHNYIALLDKNGKIKNVDIIETGAECPFNGAAVLKDGSFVIASSVCGSQKELGIIKPYTNFVSAYYIYNIYTK